MSVFIGTIISQTLIIHPTKGGDMKPTNSEKLILVMLSEIHEKLCIKNGVNTKLVTNAIYSQNTWALSWDLPGIVGDSP